jgi:hypothetical protein
MQPCSGVSWRAAEKKFEWEPDRIWAWPRIFEFYHKQDRSNGNSYSQRLASRRLARRREKESDYKSIQTKRVSAKQDGGGRSLPRTGLHCHFPSYQEKNRDFFNSREILRTGDTILAMISVTWSQTPYS